jgi:hypothetical protein
VGSGIHTDPDVLAQSAQGVGASAQDFADGLTQLQSTVTTESPWGNDEQGSIFGTLYVAVLGHAIQSMGSHLEKLVQAAEGLAGWSQLMSETEGGVTKTMTSMTKSLAG